VSSCCTMCRQQSLEARCRAVHPSRVWASTSAPPCAATSTFVLECSATFAWARPRMNIGDAFEESTSRGGGGGCPCGAFTGTAAQPRNAGHPTPRMTGQGDRSRQRGGGQTREIDQWRPTSLVEGGKRISVWASRYQSDCQSKEHSVHALEG